VKKGDSHKILVIDGSQSLPHFSVDVVDLDIDFFIATGHKVMSDTGIGILYGKKALLQKLSPALC
jgi:cysteine desulfurase / selenocysteine lyase